MSPADAIAMVGWVGLTGYATRLMPSYWIDKGFVFTKRPSG